MSGSVLLWLLFATVAFWGVGLYSRLARIYAWREEAIESLHKHVQPYANLLLTHLAGPQPAPTTLMNAAKDPRLTPEWSRLLEVLAALDAAFHQVRGASLDAPALRHLSQELDNVQHAWASLCATPGDLAGPAVPESLQAQWDSVTERVLAARARFNEISSKFNEAIGQFPARVVARPMGFHAGSVI